MERVALDGDGLRIHDLAVEGSALEAAREAVAHGRDLELIVRQMLEVGGAVLLHGGNKATVDAVGAQVDRLITTLEERSRSARAVAAERERGHLKGFAYEELLGPILDAAFAPHQDTVEHTGNSRGVQGDSRCGDFLIRLNSAATAGVDRRVVVEAKDRPLNMDRALSELDSAMANREAEVGLLVFAHAHQAPLLGRPLRALSGNRLIAVFDKDEQDELALEVACQLCRSLALLAPNDDTTWDRERVRGEVDQLVSVVERGQDIKRGLAAARRGLDAADDAYRDLREEAMAALQQLQDEV